LKPYLRNIFDTFTPRVSLVLMGMAVLVGGLTGLAAVFFIKLIAFIQSFFYEGAENLLPFIGNFAFVVVPIVGALLVGPLVAYFASEAKGHGVPEVMQALVLHGGRIRPRVAIAKITASALCIGTGGSAGREGPIVQVGSALGSSVGQWLGFSDERIKNLVACGAAAGIAATFNAPIAGVAFAAEVLMTELQGRMFGNIVISAVSASIISRIFLGAKPAFIVPTYTMTSPWEILLYALLGLLAALVGVMFIKMLSTFETVFDNWQFPLALKPAVGAMLLGLLGYFYLFFPNVHYLSSEESILRMPLMENMPHIFGSGFTFIESVLQGKVSFLLVFLLIFLKPLATSFTLGSGNSGGVFAPSLFTGAVLGGAYGYAVNKYFPDIAGNVGAYALVGMAAVFAAAARAPLTALLIVFEMSNDYLLILPLMVAGVVATLVAEWIHPDSIYTTKLTKRGIKFDQGRDLDVMQGVLVEEVMKKDPISFQIDQPFSELYAVFQETHLQGFPVTGDDNKLYGIVTMQDVTRVLSQSNVRVRELTVKDVATPNPIVAYAHEHVWAAIQKMAPRDLARLPVVTEKGGELIGLISRSDILKAYDVGIMKKQQTQYARDRMSLRKISDVTFVEVTVDPESSAVGKKLLDLPLPESSNMVSIERNGTVLIPRGDSLIKKNDFLTLVCTKKTAQKTLELFKKI